MNEKYYDHIKSILPNIDENEIDIVFIQYKKIVKDLNKKGTLSKFNVELELENFQSSNLCNSEIKAVYHFTHINNLSNIYANGLLNKLILQRDNVKFKAGSDEREDNISIRGEYPGLFMGILFNEDSDKIWPPKTIGNTTLDTDTDFVALIFSSILLKQKNYHANVIDDMGYITENTFTGKNLDKFIEKSKQHLGEDLYNLSEIVFHDKINLNSLEEIWTSNKKLYNDFKEKIPELKLITKVPEKQYNKYCNWSNEKLIKNNIIDLKSEPNFCYWVNGVRYKQYKKEIILNCGLTENDINKINSQKDIKKLIDEYFMKQNKPKPIYYPNYNWEIKQPITRERDL